MALRYYSYLTWIKLNKSNAIHNYLKPINTWYLVTNINVLKANVQMLFRIIRMVQICNLTNILKILTIFKLIYLTRKMGP